MHKLFQRDLFLEGPSNVRNKYRLKFASIIGEEQIDGACDRMLSIFHNSFGYRLYEVRYGAFKMLHRARKQLKRFYLRHDHGCGNIIFLRREVRWNLQ